MPHAAEAVRDARQRGLRAAFVTNNASRSPARVAAHLTELGIEAVAGDVVTSAQAAARELAERLPAGAAVLVVGTEDLAAEVAAVGLRPVRSADDHPAGVVQGLAHDTGLPELSEAALAIRAGAVWVAGNGDTTFPSARGPVPGNGALVAALVAATGRQPVVVGKPEPRLHRESVERVGAAHPLVIGDRLDTDVLGAVRGGTDSLLVLTGVTDQEQLYAAAAGTRPTYVSPTCAGCCGPQPEVALRDGAASCGRAVVRWTEGGPVAVAAPPDDDGAVADEVLRASCALAWARADGTGRHPAGSAVPLTTGVRARRYGRALPVRAPEEETCATH